MTLSDLSIRKPAFAWMLMAVILVFGVISYFRMGISQLPDVDFPVVTVTVTWAGAAPDVMESAVADVIEDSVMSVDGIQLVQSASQQGQTQITIQFNLDQDINVALQQVQTKIFQAQRNLPQTIDPPVITKTNPNDQPILWGAAYSEDKKISVRDLNMFVRDKLKDKITTISGVGDVTLGGYVEPQMRIWMDPKKMETKQITAQDVIAAVNDQHQLSPTGYQDVGNTETFVRVHSEFTNAEECGNLLIPARAGSPVWTNIRIGDVGRCVEGTDEIRRIARFNGNEPTVGLGIIKQHGTNAVAIGDEVRKRLQSLGTFLPPGVKIGVANDTTAFIRGSIDELLRTLGYAVLLTAFVCYLFLGSFSSAFNVILAIPVSLVGTLIVLNALGFTLNTFTLMALTLSIGIVVDDAIMVLENITRHVEEGKNRVLGSIIGAREITGPAVAASFAILAIFVPVVFMPGIVGKFFYQFGIALSCAVLISLLEALTLAPMRTSQFLTLGNENRVTKFVNRGMERLSNGYRTTLKHALNHRWKIIVSALIVFALSLVTIPFLKKEFLPPQDQSRFLVTLRTKMGSSITYTDGIFRQAEALYKTRPEVESYFVSVGGFGGGVVNQGISFVTLKDKNSRPFGAPFKSRPTQQEFMAFIRGELKKIPGVENVAILDLSLSGFSAQRGYPIEFVLQGPDWDKLIGYSTQLKEKVTATGTMADIDSDYNPNMPETEIFPDRAKSARSGVPVGNIATSVAAMVGGLKLLPNKYTDASGHRDDIQLKLDPGSNEDATDLKKIMVRNVQGEVVPLVSLVTIKEANTLLTITRYNRERGISIYGNFAPGKSQSDAINAVKEIGKQVLPPGYFITFSGSSQAFADSFNSLAIAFFLGIFVAYAVLASQFNSFLHPAIILLALPFSLSGALIGMKLTGTSLNIYSIIGILLLMGIVKKNSILLVQFTNQARAEQDSEAAKQSKLEDKMADEKSKKRESHNPEVDSALLKACPIRLRPILMTSIATIAGAIPEALAHGSGSEVIRPMAIAVIGGVLLSTFLTLFVVPCAYSLTARFEGKKNKKLLKEALVELEVIEERSESIRHEEAAQWAEAHPEGEAGGHPEEQDTKPGLKVEKEGPTKASTPPAAGSKP